MENVLTLENEALTALYDYLGIKIEGVAELQSWDHYGLPVYEIDGQEYAIGTDEEANSAARSYIEDSLWAFNANFILDCCGLDRSGAESLQNMQEKACEDANGFIASLIKRTGSIDHFVERAIQEDGRGYLLSRYDGEEIELLGGKYYAYKL
jgi:hypothetical protein